MSMAADSAVVRFFLWIWTGFVGLWRRSALGRLVCPGGRGLRSCAGESLVCRVVAREGALTRAWPHSILCRVVTAV